MKSPSPPLCLGVNAGFVDTAGFLALQGLFTAHVTGNFVTLGASLAIGASGVLAKLHALPVFVLVVALSRAISAVLSTRGGSLLATLLALNSVPLVATFGLAVSLGPSANGDAGPAILTGVVAVTGMAIQNAAQPSGDRAADDADDGERHPGRHRWRRPRAPARSRAGGGRPAAPDDGKHRVLRPGLPARSDLDRLIHMWCFAVPPLVALLAMVAERSESTLAPGPARA